MNAPTIAPPRPPFKVAGSASIKHLNVRKEGPDDEKILAVDVKVSIMQVDRHICGYFDDALEAFLWRGDTDALIVRNAFLAPTVYLNQITGANVRIGEHEFHGCEVKKFSIEPRDGGVVTLMCSIALYPNSSDVSELARLVQEDTNVSIEGPPDLFAEPGAVAAISTTPTEHGDGPDPMLDQAVQVIRANKKASISLVQRHLKIGYNRAARLLEAMEKAGVVSPMESNGSRKILAAH